MRARPYTLPRSSRSISQSWGKRSAMRNMSVRDLESTPGQLYWRRSDPEMTRTRNGRAAVGSLPLSSLGRIGFLEESLRFGCVTARFRVAALARGGKPAFWRTRLPGNESCAHLAVAGLFPGLDAAQERLDVAEALLLILFCH